nr:MAG TPA: hypothetical protein [Caudoviricetes sp.]
MKKTIISLGQWGQKHWLQLIIIMSILMMVFLFLVLLSWLFGYWSNALRGTHFELMSCWSGVTAVVGGFATIVGLGKACWTKYGYDSRFNSARYTMPTPPVNPLTTANNTEKVKEK